VDKESFDQLRRANRLLGLEQKRDFQRGFRSAGLIPKDTETEFSFLENQFMVGDSFSENTELNREDLNENLKWISDAKRMSDWVIVSFHCHESGKTMAEPPEFLIDFAHECIDAGASVFIGHGPHVTRGIEIYKGAPILYSLGNFIFQNDTVKWQPSYNYDQIGLDHYFTPADFYDKRSDEGKRGFPADPIYWQSVVAQIKFENGNLSSLDVVPIDMGYGKPRSMTGRPLIASGKIANQALSRIKELSEDMGTDVSIDGNRGIVTF
jgi:poly-gamma-glutamate synthesis protein (capsule biosynthesis protein)